MLAAAPCAEVLVSSVRVLISKLPSGSLRRLTRSILTIPLTGTPTVVVRITGG